MALVELLRKHTDLLTQDFEQSITERKLFPSASLLAEDEQDDSDAQPVLELLTATGAAGSLQSLEQVFGDPRFVVFERAKNAGSDDYADTLYDELQEEHGEVLMYLADLTYERMQFIPQGNL